MDAGGASCSSFLFRMFLLWFLQSPNSSWHAGESHLKFCNQRFRILSYPAEFGALGVLCLGRVGSVRSVPELGRQPPRCALCVCLSHPPRPVRTSAAVLSIVPLVPSWPPSRPSLARADFFPPPHPAPRCSYMSPRGKKPLLCKETCSIFSLS